MNKEDVEKIERAKKRKNEIIELFEGKPINPMGKAILLHIIKNLDRTINSL